MAALDRITLKGFKSIRELVDFKLEKLNLIVGANGAGKSNLVDFFRLLRAMAHGELQTFVTKSGGADGFFFNGPKETTQISAHLQFPPNEYRFTLEPTVAGEMMIREEGAMEGILNALGFGIGASKESRLPTWKDLKSESGWGNWGNSLSPQAYVYQAVSSWIVYHFHDTSSTAPMRRESSVRDIHELRPDAGNIAPFLLRTRGQSRARYDRIRETVQTIAPFFDEFVLEPYLKGNSELVRLEWRQKGSSFPFQPWQFSDGTIRFICLATALLQPKLPSTVVIDEPELGLHPYALEVLAQLLKEAAGHTQLVIATQSAALLNHFEPKDVVVVDRVDGASQFRRLEAEPLADWLKDYALGELLQKNVIEAGPTHA